MLTGLASAILVLGRVLIGAAFLVSAFRNLTNLTTHEAFMVSRGVPQARLVLIAGLALEAICGALLVIGLWTPWAAAGLIVFMVTVMYVYHNPMTYQGAERSEHINVLTSGTMIVGGLVLLMVV